MAASRMHDDEVDTDASLARRLLAAQFPQWAELPIERVTSAGTDNALYRLGDGLVARLPRIHWAADDVEKECAWLPHLAPFLPLAVPMPLAKGAPGEGYPWSWSVYTWLDGVDAGHAPFADLTQVAGDLARFIGALRGIDATGGPAAGRGVPLATRDEDTRAVIASRHSALAPFDADALTSAWEAALRAPVWDGPPVWVHGDLGPLNLIVQQGRLGAVIDWGATGVGDPACDLIVAWSLFTAETRGVFRAALGVDDAMWARGRGWALTIGLIALPYYHVTNPALAAVARRAISQVLADERGGG